MKAPTMEEIYSLKQGDLNAWDGYIPQDVIDFCKKHVQNCYSYWGDEERALFTEGIEVGMVIMKKRMEAK